MRRVLFVDDEPRILEGLRRMLHPQRYDWEMAFAPGGEAALALMEASLFDVVVSDMRMPGMDGAALLSRVRDQYPQVVRIVLSGHTELASAMRAVPVAHQFLAKPCDADKLRVAIERACHLKALLNDDSIRRTVGALGDLPSLPRTYQALTSALADPETPVRKIAAIVEQDVGISAKVLQLCNSAFFGVSHSITNIQRAVTLLGINTLKSLVLSVDIFQVFKPSTPLPGFSWERLQHHGRLTASIAARLPVPKLAADDALAGAMLHDAGKLILAWKLPERFKKSLAEATAQRHPLHQVEERDYGFSHAEIGAYLLGLWGLPYTVVEAVALHHAPNRVPHQGCFDAVSAVYVANLLACELEADSPQALPEDSAETHEQELVALGIQQNMPDWRALAAEVPAQLVEA
jgi:HD-like signal output (HDOD) protein